MKKLLLFTAITILTTVVARAEGPSITVQNQEQWRFWYVIDAPVFEGESPGSAWLAQKAASYLATEGEDFPFLLLQPGEAATLTDIEEGTHFLLGFFEDDSLAEFPVRLIALQADESIPDRHYDVYSLPELLLAARGEGMLAMFALVEQEATADEVEETGETIQAEPAIEEALATAEEAAVVEGTAEEAAVAETAGSQAVAEEAGAEEAAAEEPTAEEIAGDQAGAVEIPAEEIAAEEVPVEETIVEEAAVEETAEEAALAEEAVLEETAVEEAIEEPLVEGAATPEEAAETAEEEPPGPLVLATFADAYDPVYFTRESRDAFIVLPIASSRAWGRPGTRLAEFSGTLDDGTFTLVLRSRQAFARNVSCFFYVFPTRTAGGSSQYTFEARPQADGRAAVVLWQKGRSVPRLVGTARTDGGEFTWTARADELPPELAEQLGAGTTFDLTTAWLDETSGTWEEFYFTTFAVADLTR